MWYLTISLFTAILISLWGYSQRKILSEILHDWFSVAIIAGLFVLASLLWPLLFFGVLLFVLVLFIDYLKFGK